jgi:hypothetical protein
MSRRRGIVCSVAAAVAAALACAALAAPAAASAPTGVTVTPFSQTSKQVAAGPFTKIYDPSVGESQPWYINDHTIVRGRDGTWHLFGITHPEPADPDNEVNFAHATAPTLHGPWTKQPFALTVDPSFGETHLWAPYVMSWKGRYYMFYAGGGGSTTSEISVATSTDLWHWTRYRSDPLFRDGYDARDPFILRIGHSWVMYYTATDQPTGGHHIVAYRTSRDLLHWGSKHVAYTDPASGTFGGGTESPFVVHHHGRYYLFIGPRRGYVGTDVFASGDPLHFSIDHLVGHIAAHALEVVRDTDGSWWVTSAGWGQGGVSLAPLDWRRAATTSGYDVTTSHYRARLTTHPEPDLTSLSVPDGGSRQQLLDSAFRGTLPYAGIGGFGDTDRPGVPASTTTGTDGTIAMTGIPIGDEPVTVDWTLKFRDTDFDTSFDWHVSAAPSAPAFEASWSLDTTLPRLGDSTNLDQNGDAPGFAHWTLAGDDRVSLVAAYRTGSAWSESNHWFDPSDGAISWQPLWNPAGTTWAPGDYPGGTWRIGVSEKPADTAYADALYAAVNAGR